MATPSSATGIQWNLKDLYESIADPKLQKDMQEAQQRAKLFCEKYRGRIAAGPTAELLAKALEELESVSEQLDKPLIYAHLLHAAKTDDPRHGALLSKTREARTEANQYLIFFDLEWVSLDEAAARLLLNDDKLINWKHYLEVKRQLKPHYLSEPEEKLLDEKNNTGKAAFIRLFDETVAGLEFNFILEGKSEKQTLQQMLARLYDPQKEVRRAAAEGLTQGLQSSSKLLTYIFNNLLQDHHTDTRLRHFQGPMHSRNLANEITQESVDALMQAAERHQGMVERYYRLKAQLLGLPELHDYDRYAPLGADLPACNWPEARTMVEESYKAFSGEAGRIVGEFFKKNWIDAEPRPGKRGGAFSASTVPSCHPYILMSFTDKLRDVMTLAHELGHGLHQYVSRHVGYLQCDTPLTTAETASVFGEMLTFKRLMEKYIEPRVQLALLCSKIEDSFATVFRQVVLTRFEQQAHAARQAEGELTTERLNQLWMEANRPMHGTAVKLTEGYAWWWLYIGHFVHVPFYCYAYAFGDLLVLALYEQYRRTGESFVPKYMEMLTAGGSMSPPELVKKLGIDINQPSFWDQGLKLLDGMVTEAERLSRLMNN
ncbi:MAG TPA: M3 family oligoendopeptidase [Gemmatales bacterium]|nr:M3 family oligoendopeptidase [Gemmatales bacterium]